MTRDDLETVSWLDRAEKRNARRLLVRAHRNEAVCFKACDSSKSVVGKVALDLSEFPGEGFVLQLAVEEHQRRRGIARQLVRASETRALQMGLRSIVVTVERSNDPARSLYTALGYEECGERVEAWAEIRDGEVIERNALSLVMRRQLADDPVTLSKTESSPDATT